LTLSEDEDELNCIEDSLSQDYRPKDPSSESARSYKLQEIDGKGHSCQSWRNDSRCLFIPDILVIAGLSEI
jgi:hypothetical protein